MRRRPFVRLRCGRVSHSCPVIWRVCHCFCDRRKETGKERADSHPLYTVLHDAPNDEIDSFRFVELMMTHLLTWGNFYAEIVTDEAGRVRQLWPLAPWLVRPERPDPNGLIVYRVRLPRAVR